jgi:hypothetical protein
MNLRASRPRRTLTGRALIGTTLALLGGLALAACAGDLETPSSPPSTGPTVAPSGPTSIPTDPGSTDATVPTQTDTEWGRIWDGLPEGFPEYPGATPTETGEGPASAFLDAGDVEPAAVAGYYVPALEFLGYHTLNRSEPREDGSIEVEWAGETTCRIRITSTPMGGSTIVEVMYGADCPFE